MAVPVPLLLFLKIGVGTLWACFAVLAVSLVAVALSVWILGLNPGTRQRLLQAARKRLGI